MKKQWQKKRNLAKHARGSVQGKNVIFINKPSAAPRFIFCNSNYFRFFCVCIASTYARKGKKPYPFILYTHWNTNNKKCCFFFKFSRLFFHFTYTLYDIYNNFVLQFTALHKKNCVTISFWQCEFHSLSRSLARFAFKNKYIVQRFVC